MARSRSAARGSTGATRSSTASRCATRSDLRNRLALNELTLTPADLLLTKLQVVETDERDLKDMTALLRDTEMDDELRDRIEAAPKSLRWRARAKIGDCVRWYDEPEED